MGGCLAATPGEAQEPPEPEQELPPPEQESAGSVEGRKEGVGGEDALALFVCAVGFRWS